MSDLQPLFWPRSIALVGASPNRAIIRGRIVEAVQRHEFHGPIYAVSRTHAEIDGLRAVPSVDQLPEPVDLAIITIPAPLVAEALEACGRKGVRAAVIISSGFAEEHTDEGPRREREVAEIAARYAMAVIGPNAEGFLNARMPLAASFSPALSAIDDGLVPARSRGAGIAVVSQSGGVGFAFFDRGRPKGLRFSYVVSMGNEAVVDTLEVTDYLLDDRETEVVLVFLEGLERPSDLPRVAAKAARMRKPLIVAKMGRSESAALAAASHTASLAGSHRAYSAMFRRYGVQSGEDVDQMIDTAAVFSYFRDRLPRSKRVAVLTPSGGAGIWLADACAAAGLDVPELDPETRAAIDRMLPDYGASRNPVDITAQVIFQTGYVPSLEILLASPTVDAVLVCCSLINTHYIEKGFAELCELGRSVDKPVVFCSYTRPHPRAVSLLAEAGFPCLSDMPNAARAVSALADYQAFLDRFEDPGVVPPERDIILRSAGDDGATRVVSEHDTKQWLERSGISSPPGVLVQSAAHAVSAAADIGAPVALKVQSVDLPHKSNVAGVVLGLSEAGDIEAKFDAMLAEVRARAPSASLQGVRVERMARPGLEMIVGVSRDRDFGPMLTVGFGGVLVELLDDVAMAPLPLSRSQAGHLLGELRGHALLDGVRGGPPVDREALIDLIVRLSDCVVAHADTLVALDLNPVIVHERGAGVSLADAMLVLSDSVPGN